MRVPGRLPTTLALLVALAAAAPGHGRDAEEVCPNPQDWRPSPEALRATLKAHRDWLDNEGWRHPAIPSRSAVLCNADLSEAQLRGAILPLAQLRAADLSSAQLQGADLRGAVLTGAQVQGAVLHFAMLQNADLTGAQLQGAVLHFAMLQNADLTGAQLRGARLFKTNLTFVRFCDTVMPNGSRCNIGCTPDESDNRDCPWLQLQESEP